MISPIIHAAFQTSHDQFELGNFIHSGIHFSKVDFDSLEAKEAIWFGAYDEYELIGCVAVTLVSTVRARLHKLAVLPNKRGTGLGSLLVLHAEREAFARGARKIELVCLANDVGLVSFYSRQNYKLLKEKQHKQTVFQIAYMEKRMPHLIDQVGEKVHAYLLPVQEFETLKKQQFEVVLVYHPKEINKPSNTGHVIQRSLPAHTKEFIWHRHTLAKQVAELSLDYETVLLYPSEEAIPLEQYCKSQGDLQKPIRLVVIDGTWQQAQKMMLQSPVLEALPKVKLVHLPKSQYVLRKNQKPMGLCTLESVAEALSELGYSEAKTLLMNTFYEWLEIGYNRYRG
jgi:DTW domain-containing protein YfiP/GNAT superfamily N-acetyltransferase